MPFAFEKKSIRPHSRLGRDTIPIHLGDDDLKLMDDARAKTAGCLRRMDFVAAAILWFESLDREEQVNIISAFGEAKPSHLAVSVVDVFAHKVDMWRFPLYSKGKCVGAAVCTFCKVSKVDRDDWMQEMIRFVCR